MGLFRRKKQADRSYYIKLKRASYAKLGLLAQRLEATEGDTLDGIIDFALANYGTTSQTTGGNLDIASIITGESGDTDITSELVKAILPKLLSGDLGKPNPSSTTSDNPAPESSGPMDATKALRELGL